MVNKIPLNRAAANDLASRQILPRIEGRAAQCRRHHGRTRLLAAGFRSILIVVFGLACLVPVAQARVSLADIDAKLDALLAAQAIDLDRRVELRAKFSSETICARDRGYFRIYPDGTEDSAEFVVPRGHTLVILEVSWRAIDDPNSGFSANRGVRLSLSSSEPDGLQSIIFYNSPQFYTGSATTFVRPGTHETLIMGAAVGEGRIVCPIVSSATQSGGSAHTVDNSTLRGILVPDQ